MRTSTPLLSPARIRAGLLVVVLCGIVTAGYLLALRAVGKNPAASGPARPQMAEDAYSRSRWRIVNVVDGVPNFISYSNNLSGPVDYLLGAGPNRISFYLKAMGASPIRIRIRSWLPDGTGKILFETRIQPGHAGAERRTTFKIAGARGWRGLYSDALAISQGPAAARRISLEAIRSLVAGIRRRSLKRVMRLIWMREIRRNAPRKLARQWAAAAIGNWGPALKKYRYLYVCPSKDIRVRIFQRGILIWTTYHANADIRTDPLSGPALIKLFSKRPKKGTAADAFGDLTTLPSLSLLWTGKRWVFAPI